MFKRFGTVGASAFSAALIVGWGSAVVGQQSAPAGGASLDGLWAPSGFAPLERDPRFGTRELMTDEDAAMLAKEAAARREARKAPTRETGSEQHVQGGYHDLAPPPTAAGPRKQTGPRFNSLVIDPADGRIPPYTPEAQRQAKIQREFEVMLLQASSACKTKQPECEGGTYGPVSPRYGEVPPYYAAQSYFAGGLNRAYGPEDMDLRTRCLLPPAPNWGGMWRIVQGRNAVAINYEGFQGQTWVRTIPVTDRPHAPAPVRFWGGDSRARWEGNTLVVDVTNFDPRTIYPDDGGYSGRVGGARENLHLIEKYTRVDDDTLRVVMTLEDPTTWTRPWTVRQEFKRQNAQENLFFYEPRCHEGNHGLIDILSGAREMDRRFKQGKGPDPATTCIAQCGGDRDNFPQ